MAAAQKYFNALQDSGSLQQYSALASEFNKKVKGHGRYMQDNARPLITVRCEVDKFRGFLHDVLSFEPDFILQEEKPRLHYFDDQ